MTRRQVLKGMAATAAVAGTTRAWAGAPAVRAGTVTLQYMTANLTEKQYEPVWKEMIAKFEAQNPNIKVEPILVARKDHWTKFVTASKAGQAPDVVAVDIATAAYNGYLRPLDDLWSAEPASYRQAWSPDVLSAASWQGKLYGLPSWGGIYGEIVKVQSDTEVQVEIAEGVRVRMQRGAIAEVVTRSQPANDEGEKKAG